MEGAILLGIIGAVFGALAAVVWASIAALLGMNGPTSAQVVAASGLGAVGLPAFAGALLVACGAIEDMASRRHSGRQRPPRRHRGRHE